jgi:hypothetical protein
MALQLKNNNGEAYSMGSVIITGADGKAKFAFASSGAPETDPIFTAHPAFSITAPNIVDWNTAFGWGNHATAGYVTLAGTQTITGSKSFSLGIKALSNLWVLQVAQLLIFLQERVRL